MRIIQPIIMLIMVAMFPMALSSCNSDSKLEDALSFSGDNRIELERVLDYFEYDQEKYAAAKFLIENMPGHKCMVGDYRSYFDEVKECLSKPHDNSISDTITNISKDYKSKIKYEYVSKVIKADYLIKDIETAFKQWKEGEWAQHLNFDEFCEWLLPYSCSQTQPLMDWRELFEPFRNEHLNKLSQCEEFRNSPTAAIKLINDSLRPVMASQSFKNAYEGFPIYDMEVLVNIPGTICKNYADLATLLMRSKGCPIAMDFIVQWPTRMNGHDWSVFPTLRGETTKLDPFFGIPDYPHKPYAKYGKVYRRTYAPNEEYLALLLDNKGDIPPIFDDPFFRDVTHEYGKVVDIIVDLMEDMDYRRKDVYLAVFNNREWVPIFWGERKGARAHFNSVANNITYIVLGYDDGKLRPISHPFRLNLKNEIEYMYVDNQKGTVSFSLERKYPLLKHVYDIYECLEGGYVEASNTPTFQDAEIVCEFADPSWTSGTSDVNQSQPYRYWRFVSCDSIKTELAEIYFGGEPISQYIKDYKIIDAKNQSDQPFSNLFDGDPLTNFRAPSDTLCGYIDYGKPVILPSVSYIRRGDGNAIVPDDEYHIYYWKGCEWNLHSVHIPHNIKLDIKNLPEGGLYYIKGITRGVENRIFRYNKEKEVVEWM